MNDLEKIMKSVSAFDNIQKAISQSMTPLNSIQHEMEKFKKLSSMLQIATQMEEIERRRWDSIRKVVNPLESIRTSLNLDASWLKVLEDLKKPMLVTEQLSRAIGETSEISIALKHFQENASRKALQHARDTYALTNVAESFSEAQKAFHAAHKGWELPRHLVDSVGALSALEEKIGRLTLPVMGWDSVAALAQTLGREGLAEELEALGIGENGEFNSQAANTGDGGYLTPKQRDLLTILGIILTLLIFNYQEWSSQQPTITDVKLNAHTVMLETQAKTLESLSALVEQALIKESASEQTRFVVLDRVATVRAHPEAGSSVESKLLPREVVTLVSERGKWIEVRYYHWIIKEYQTGWALKKYLKRVPSSHKFD